MRNDKARLGDGTRLAKLSEIAAKHGLKLASELPPKTRAPVLEPVAHDGLLPHEAKIRHRLSAAEREAEARLGLVAVVIYGPPEPVPLRIGANQGGTPVIVSATRDPDGYLRNLNVGWHEVVKLAQVWTSGQVFADELVTAIEVSIKARGEHVRRRWHDLDPAIAEEFLWLEAGFHTIEIFDGDERVRRIKTEATRGARGWHERG